MMRVDVVRAVEAYLNGLGSKDLSAAPFHPDVDFEGPLGPPVKGAAALREFLTGFFPLINGVKIVRHIVDGEWCATPFSFDTRFGVIAIMDCFRVVDGQIVSIRPYYDPRAIVEGTKRMAGSA
jgi:limonene-1,2-epoxide hydrolase